MKQQIQRHSEKPIVGMKGRKNATSDSCIDQSAGFFEQKGRFGPGHIIKISCDNYGHFIIAHPFSHTEQIAIPFFGSFLFGRTRRRRVNGKKDKTMPIGSFQFSFNTGNIIGYKIMHLTFVDLQIGIKMHAVGIVQRYLLKIGIILFQYTQGFFPCGVTFHCQKDIWLFFLNQANKAVISRIELQHITRDHFDTIRCILALFIFFATPKFGIADQYIGMVYNQRQLYTLQVPDPRIFPHEIKTQCQCWQLKYQQLQLHKFSYPKDPMLALDKG